VIAGSGSQIRPAVIPTPDGFTTRPLGLDFGAIMMMGAARGVDTAMLSEILPRIESAVLNPPDPDAYDEEADDDHA